MPYLCFVLEVSVMEAVAYAENFRGRAKFRRKRVTSQINCRGSAESTTILGGLGPCPGKILQYYT